MVRELSMMSPEDLDFVSESERETFIGVSEGISFLMVGSGTIDPYTQEFLPAAPRWTLASGTLSVINEGDVLLGMGGKLQVGDYAAKFYYPDVMPYVDAQFVRREATGEVYTVEARVRTGLGPPFTRLELGLQRKPNE